MEGIIIGIIISAVVGGGSYVYFKQRFAGPSEPGKDITGIKAQEQDAAQEVPASESEPERSSDEKSVKVQDTGDKGVSVDTQVQTAPPVYRKPTEEEVNNSPLVIESRARSRELVIEAKSQALKIKSDAEEEVRKIKDKATEVERNILIQKAQLEAKEKDLENRARTLKAAKETIEKKQEEVDTLHGKQSEALEKIAALSKEEARKILLEKLDKELVEEKGKKIREKEEEIRRRSDELAQEILVEAMRFGATDIVVEYTTSKVKLPDEDIKGRIIGKEGRNIRTFEEMTGVDLDLDSSPGEVIVSSFDPVRREIAKVSMEKLLADGRIQPAKIEEIVQKTTSEIEHLIYKAGDDLCHKVGVYNIPKELVQMLGKFKYRFSYGQNMIEHTLEETRIGMAIAHELNANVEVVKMACLFHDIGKVVTDDEGTHIDLGVDLLKRFKIDENVVNCVAEHHEDKPFSSIESAIVNLADHVSGARPGARSEDYESYVERLKALEEAATSFDGVEKAFAVSAGREVRVFVSPEHVDDSSTSLLAREIARKIELEQTYPGVVKVIVIRETRAQETAK